MLRNHVNKEVGALAAVAALVLSGCGGADDAEVEALKERVAELEQSPAAAAAPPPTSAAPVVPDELPPPATAAPEPVDTVDFAMPDFSGVNLQDAQDQVQGLGVFYSVSHDLLGSRNQVLDGNWRVCDQTPAAGAQITGPATDWEGKIDFGAVKLNESCP